MSANISQQIKVDHALSYQAVSNANANTTYYPMANYDRIEFVVDGGVIAGAITCEIRQSTDTNVSNANVISGAPANITVTTNTCNVIEVRTSLLNIAGGFDHVGVRVSGSSAGVCNVSAIVLRYPGRYNQETLLT